MIYTLVLHKSDSSTAQDVGEIYFALLEDLVKNWDKCYAILGHRNKSICHTYFLDELTTRHWPSNANAFELTIRTKDEGFYVWLKMKYL